MSTRRQRMDAATVPIQNEPAAPHSIARDSFVQRRARGSSYVAVGFVYRVGPKSVHVRWESGVRQRLVGQQVADLETIDVARLSEVEAESLARRFRY